MTAGLLHNAHPDEAETVLQMGGEVDQSQLLGRKPSGHRALWNDIDRQAIYEGTHWIMARTNLNVSREVARQICTAA